MRVSRRIAVLAAILVAVALFGTTRPEWVRAAVPDLVGSARTVAVTGGKASPGAVAMGVAALAAAVLTSLAGRRLAVLTGAIIAAAGGGAAVMTIDVLRAPATHAEGAVAADAGLIGAITGAHTTVWPWLALGPCALLVVVGVLIAVRARSWQTAARYTREAVAPDAGEQAAPEEARPDAAARAGAPASVDEDPAAMWDALTRGEDPTRPADGRKRESR